MGTEYLLDSNTVIEFLGGMLPSASVNQLNNIVDRDEHHLSVINQIELLGFNGSTSEMQTIEAFIMVSSVVPLHDAIVQKTIELRKNYKIKLPDAVIAATALVHRLTLVTRNISDFEKIQELEVVDSHAM